jgi:hypothetical protein
MEEARYSDYKTRDAVLHAQESRTRHETVNAEVTSCVIITNVLRLQQGTDMAHRRHDMSQ